MHTVLMTMFVGASGASNKGIAPELALFFCNNGKYYWVKKQIDNISTKSQSISEAEPLHYPESEELTYIITDALLRYCPQISTSYDKIRELFNRIESSTGMQMAEFFEKYSNMRDHRESRRLLSLARELFEDSRIESKIVIHALVGSPIQQVTENILRMNTSFELGISTKYRLKGKAGLEESL